MFALIAVVFVLEMLDRVYFDVNASGERPPSDVARRGMAHLTWGYHIVYHFVLALLLFTIQISEFRFKPT